jgi:flagellar biosynthesis/type III secretory pathway chaperone
MTPAPATPDVCEALRVEIAGFRTLHRILEAEADALRRADPDALSVLTPAKLQQVAALQSLARDRSAALRDAGLPDTAAGLKAWLAAGPDALRAQEAWKTLAALAIEAKRQNEINGRLAARQRWHFDAALGALLQAAGVQSVYGADGRTRRQDAPQTRFAV